MKVSKTNVSKKFLIAIALLGSASFANADYKLVPADDSALSKVCIAATSGSREATIAAAAAAGIGLLDLQSVRCNGMTLERFGAKYRNAKKDQVALLDTSTSSPLSVVLKKTDESPLTELCAAAATSDAAYQRVKEAHFSNDYSIEAEIKCNDLPLKSFVRKYRASAALVSSR
jgi:hypothetical protein